MPVTTNLQTFTRVPVPSTHEPMQPVVTDIYNKLATLQGSVQKTQATAVTSAQVAATVQTAATAAVASAIPAAINGIIPVVNVQPNSIRPLVDRNGSQVEAVDGAVCSWNVGGSDLGVIYQYSLSTGAWVYVAGVVSRTQANLATLAASLTTADAGLLADVTDFAHILKWSGTAWGYADPSDPAGRVETFLVDPSPTTGWHLLDGTANVPYLKSDGTTATQTLPDLVSVAANAAYPKMGSPASATPNAAVAPDSPLAYDGVTTGYILNNGAGTSGHTAQAKFTVAADTTAALTAIKDGTNGEPRNLVLRPWFRV